jgi:hypothetical protein
MRDEHQLKYYCNKTKRVRLKTKNKLRGHAKEEITVLIVLTTIF